MTVKDVAAAAGISTKTLSNRLLRAGEKLYRTNDEPRSETIMALLKPNELDVFNNGYTPGDTVQKPLQKVTKAVQPVVDVEAIMDAVGEKMKKRDTTLFRQLLKEQSDLKDEVGAKLEELNYHLYELQNEDLAEKMDRIRAEYGKQLETLNLTWNHKLIALHDASEAALEAARATSNAIPASNNQNAGMVGLLFGSELALLVAAALLMCFGAFAYQRVVCYLVGTDNWGTVLFSFLAGLVVHYAGLLNAYRKSKAPAPRYGTHPVVYWIAAFMVFESVLHACNYEVFGTDATQYVAGIVMTISVPLATAALADAMLTPNTQNDGSTN